MSIEDVAGEQACVGGSDQFQMEGFLAEDDRRAAMGRPVLVLVGTLCCMAVVLSTASGEQGGQSDGQDGQGAADGLGGVHGGSEKRQSFCVLRR